MKRVSCFGAFVATVLVAYPSHAIQLFGDVQHADALPAPSEQMKAIVHRQDIQLLQQQPTLAPQRPMQGTVSGAAPLQGEASGRAPLQGTVVTLDRPAVEWFMIPRWMAGRWHKKGDLTISVTDLRTGRSGVPNVWTENEMNVHWGHQYDRAGNIWHANFIPSEKDGNSETELVRFVAVAQKCEVSTPEQLVTRTHYMVTKTLDGSNQIVNMFQQETLNDYVALETGEVENKSSNKMFHMDGQPYRVGILQSKFGKIAEFAPTNIDRGIDMRQALADYLHAHQMDDLIPQQVSMSAP
jgi:hypothetical protein